MSFSHLLFSPPFYYDYTYRDVYLPFSCSPYRSKSIVLQSFLSHAFPIDRLVSNVSKAYFDEALLRKVEEARATGKLSRVMDEVISTNFSAVYWAKITAEYNLFSFFLSEKIIGMGLCTRDSSTESESE